MDMTLSSKDSLMHYGVPGMKWGKRKVAAGATPKDQLRRIDKENTKKFNAQRDKKIDAARLRRDSGKSLQELKTAKKTYRTQKNIVGKVAARQTLDKAKEKYVKDIDTAAQLKSGKESVLGTLAVLGAIGLGVALNVAANK